MNVALTRAKHVLLVVGNANTLSSSETWSEYIEHMARMKNYVKIPRDDEMNNIID